MTSRSTGANLARRARSVFPKARARPFGQACRMTQPTTYQGSCHCGAVRYSVEVDLTQPVMACNCSMCGRSGTLLAFVPTAKFKLEQGSDALTDYLFNKENIHHLFCKV